MCWQCDNPDRTIDDYLELVQRTIDVELCGLGIDAQQLVYADDRGRWPWEVGFRGTQPVLGPRAVAA